MEADDRPLEELTKQELLDVAADRGVTVDGGATKQEIVDAINRVPAFESTGDVSEDPGGEQWERIEIAYTGEVRWRNTTTGAISLSDPTRHILAPKSE